MATTMNMNNNAVKVSNGNDSIVIVKSLADIPGGAILNVEGFTQENICAGHIIVRDNATKDLKPLAVSGNEYGALGSDTLVGVLKHTVTKSKPFGAIVTMGQVNAAASPYPLTKALIAGLPRIDFLYANPQK